MAGLQRARSIGRESLGANSELSAEVIEDALEFITPWLHGPKGNALLAGTIKVVERGSVEKMEFYNFMYLIHHLSPEVGAMVSILTDTDFPKPDLEWMRGFER